MLDQNISISGTTCLTLAASNIILDCAGYTINGSTSPNGIAGVYTTGYNSSIANCTIQGFYRGIQISAANVSVYNNRINGSGSEGIIVYNVKNASIYANRITASSSYGIYLYLYASNTRIYNNTLNGTGSRIGIQASSSGNNIYWNNFTGSSGSFAVDYNGSNTWNGSAYGVNEGNLWENVANGSGIIAGTVQSVGFSNLYVGTSGPAYPYNNITSASRVDNVVDYSPLTPSIPCSNFSTPNSTYRLGGNTLLRGSGVCFNLTAPNITLDCAGFSIIGNNSSGSIGVYSSQSGATVRNCVISNLSSGVSISSAPDVVLSNNSFTLTYNSSCPYLSGACCAIFLDRANSSQVNGSVFSLGSGTYAIATNAGSGHSFLSNRFSSVACAVYLSSTNNSTISGSNVTLASTTPFYLTNGASFNTISSNNISNVSSTSDSAILVLTSGQNNSIFNNSIVCSGHGLMLSGSNVGYTQFYNNTVRSSGTQYALRFLSSTHDNYVSNNSIYGFQYGIYLDSVYNSSFSNNTFYTPTSYALLIQSSISDNFTDNTIYNATSTGFYVSSGSSLLFARNIVNRTQTGFYLTSASSNILRDNRVYTATSRGYQVNSAGSTNNTLTNNTASSCGVAFSMDGSASLTQLYNNTALTSSNYGFMLSSSANNTLTNNSARDSAQSGLYLTNAANNTFNDNYLGTSATSADQGAVYLTSASSANTFTNNTLNSTSSSANSASAICVNSGQSNTFSRNTLLISAVSGTPAINLSTSSGNNTFLRNNLTSSVWVSDSNGTNVYNDSTYGNIYYLANATPSWSVLDIYDLAGSGWATAGASLPLNASNAVGNWSGLGSDAHPYTPNTVPQLLACQALNQSNTSYRLARDVSTTSTCFTLSAPNITLDCQGHSISGNNASGYRAIFILSGATGATLLNCSARNFENVVVVNASNALLSDLTLNGSNCNCLDLYNSTSALVRRSSIYHYGTSCSSLAIEAGDNITLENNTISGINGVWTGSLAIVGLRVVNNTFSAPASAQSINLGAFTTGAIFALNNFSGSGTYIRDANGGNFYNATINGVNQGNLYANVQSGAVQVNGHLVSSIPGLFIGASGSGYPYSSSTSGGKVESTVLDYAPLTPNPQANVFGNVSNLNISGESAPSNLSITIDSINETNGQYFNASRLVNLTTSAQPLLSFNYNFSSSSINFSRLSLVFGQSGSRAYASVSGINASAMVGTKTLYLYNTSTAYNAICVKDAEGVSYANISSDCSVTDEHLVVCDGATHSNYSCSLSGTTLVISGLLHSAALQFSGPATSTSSGGSSYSLPTLAYSFDCASGALNVSVRTAGGSAISDISVTLADAYGSFSRTQSSDSDGLARFSIPSSGSYRIESAARDYYTAAAITPSPITLVSCARAPEPAPNSTPSVSAPAPSAPVSTPTASVPTAAPASPASSDSISSADSANSSAPVQSSSNPAPASASKPGSESAVPSAASANPGESPSDPMLNAPLCAGLALVLILLAALALLGRHLHASRGKRL